MPGFTSEKRVTTTVKTEGIYRVSTSGDGADYAVIADAADGRPTRTEPEDLRWWRSS